MKITCLKQLVGCTLSTLQKNELYALWLLLNHVKGPQSYKDIQTVKGVTHDSFKDTAIALGLVKDDYI